MYSALSTLITMTEVPLSKAPNPQLLPGRRSINGCPLLRVCVNGVCVCLGRLDSSCQSKLHNSLSKLLFSPDWTFVMLSWRGFSHVPSSLCNSEYGSPYLAVCHFHFHFHVIQFNLWLSERALYLYVCISEEEVVKCDMFICSRC